MRTIFKGLCVSTIALAAAGCQITPNPKALDKSGDVPAAFTAPVVDKTAPIWPAVDWWTNFAAPELPDLMQSAIKNNLDIKNAVDNVLIAEANDAVALQPLFPGLSGSLGATESGSASTNSGRFSAGLSSSYVLDFFGANQSRLKAADENLRSARYAQVTTGLTTESSVALTYFTILATRERITNTRQNLDLARQLLAITQAKFAAGVSSNLDVQNELVTVAGQEAALPGLIESEREARYALAILLGLPPEGFDVKAQNLDGIAVPSAQPGIPSDLLLRRPDIAAAEASLFAAHANVDAARAAFFPSVNLSGSVSFGSSILGMLFNPASFAWSLGSSLAQTIFDAGATDARYQSSQASQDAAINTYRKTVFNAFSATESAMGAADAVAQQLDLTQQQEKASAEALRISTLQYREGTVDITTLISAQTSLFNNQNSLVSTRLTRLQDSITLYIALGGGWNQKQSDADFKSTLDLDWFPITKW